MNNIMQRQLILDYIAEHGSITTMEAMSLGIASPTKRFSEIDRLYGLEKKWEKTLNRYGKPVKYIRYSL